MGPRACTDVGRTERFLDSAGNRTPDRLASSPALIANYTINIRMFWKLYLFLSSSKKVTRYLRAPTHLGALQEAVLNLSYCGLPHSRLSRLKYFRLSSS